MIDEEITDGELEEIESRCAAATKGPWESFIEGRDFGGGNDIIRTGGLDSNSPDIELVGGATPADYDFIAHARQDVPRLAHEVRRLRSLLSK